MKYSTLQPYKLL